MLKLTLHEDEYEIAAATSATSHTAAASINDVQNDLWHIIFTNVHANERLSGGSELVNDYDADEEEEEFNRTPAKKRLYKALYYGRIVVLLICWMVYTFFLTKTKETEILQSMLSVSPDEERFYNLHDKPTDEQSVAVTLHGPFRMEPQDNYQTRFNERLFPEAGTLEVIVQEVISDGSGKEIAVTDTSPVWKLSLVKQLENIILIERHHVFTLQNPKVGAAQTSILRLKFKTIDYKDTLTMQIIYVPEALPTSRSVLFAGLIVFGMHSLFYLNAVHRTAAVVYSCTMAIAILALLHLRPTLMTIILWMDFESLLLIFCTSIVVSHVADTGILDWLTVKSFELSNGHIWPVLNTLCLTCAVVAALIDNVAVMFYASLVAMRISELFQLNPVPLLICIIFSVNLGSTLLPFVDDGSIDILSNEHINAQDITFTTYLTHVTPAILLIIFQTYLQLRIYYKNSNSMRFKDATEINRLKRVIKALKHSAASFSPYSTEEHEVRDVVMSKIARLRARARRIGKMPVPPPNFEEILRKLKDGAIIRDRRLMIVCSIVLPLIFLVMVLTHFNLLQQPSGWMVLLGVIIILILHDADDIEGNISRIEWSTLLFFAALEVFSQAIFSMGFIQYIGDVTEDWITNTASESRLAIAITAILLISAIETALLDVISVGTVMIKLIFTISAAHQLPLPPLIWSYILGTCVGGNATLVGAVANIITVGVVERHGYTFTFWQYLRVAFFISIGNVVVALAYLLIIYVLF